MPERNDEMSLRDALVGAMSAEPVIDDGAAADPVAEAPATETLVAEVPAEPAVPSTATEQAAVPGEAAVGAEPTAPTTAYAHAVQGSEMPSQMEMWQAFNQLIAENRRLNEAMQQREAHFGQQIAQQNAAMQEQSQAAETAIMGQFTPQSAVPKAAPAQVSAPVLNFAEISYLSPEEQQGKISQWQQEYMNYAVRAATAQIRDEVAREIAPVKEDYEAKRRIAENNAAKTTLLNTPQFADMKGKEGDLERIIASTPLLQGAKPEQKYMLAALISRGINASRQPTTEELIERASANPDVMKALEARRVSEIQQNNEGLPKVVPSSGIGNVNAVPEERPKTSEDVKTLMLRKLGINR
jgi:hypothetical protein